MFLVELAYSGKEKTKLSYRGPLSFENRSPGPVLEGKGTGTCDSRQEFCGCANASVDGPVDSRRKKDGARMMR